MRCDGDGGKERPWVAPVVQATGAPGEGNVALGAIQQAADGSSILHGQVYDEDAEGWRPVLLKRVGTSSTWQSKDLTLELPLEKIAKILPSQVDLKKELPCWPSALRKSLEAWPLKGPGTVILDPHFFTQRAAALALLGGPVVFPGAANAMGLSSTRILP